MRAVRAKKSLLTRWVAVSAMFSALSVVAQTTTVGFTVTSEPAAPIAGRDLVFDVDITNNGASARSSVEVTVVASAPAAAIWATSGCALTSTGGQPPAYKCSLGNLAAGATKRTTVVFEPVQSGAFQASASATALSGTTRQQIATRAAPVTIAAAPTSGPIARYRLYNPVILSHLLTTDANEYTTLGKLGWNQEGMAHKVYSGDTTIGSVLAMPNYRVYVRPLLKHHWTTDVNEYYTLRSTPAVYTGEGIDGYVFPAQVQGSIPLYRMFHSGINSHLWTTDQNEFNVLKSSGAWLPEGLSGLPQGVVGFVIPPDPPPPPSCAGTKPANDTQTLSCPAGQTGSITQTRSYTCQGTTWTPGAWSTTANTCVPTQPPPPPVAGSCGNSPSVAAGTLSLANKPGTDLDGWWNALPCRTWVKVSGTAPQQAKVNPYYPFGNTGFEAVISSWSSAGYSPTRDQMVFFGGGHADSADNGVYSLDTERFTWSRLSDPSPTSAYPGCFGSTGFYDCAPGNNDGKPTARHTYHTLTIAGNKFYIGRPATYGDGAYAWSFDLDARTWTKLRIPGTVSIEEGSGGMFYDSATAKLYHTMEQYKLYQVDPNTFSATKTMQLPGSMAFGPPLCHTIVGRELWMVRTGTYSGTSFRFNLDTQTFSSLSLSGSGLGDDFYWGGCAYVPELNGMARWANSGAMYVVNKDTQAQSAVALGGVPATEPLSGMLGRMVYLPKRRAVLLVPKGDSDVFVVRF